MIEMRLSEAEVATNGKLVGDDRTFTGCSIDSRTIKPGELFIAINGENHNGHDFIEAAAAKGAAAAMVDMGSDYKLPTIRVNNARASMGLLAGHWRGKFGIPFIAVTGSNGKTTVKEMVKAILSVDASLTNTKVLATQGNLNNDIGVPLTLFNLGREHRFAVIEMGANHAGEIRWSSGITKPDVALITQCAPAHLAGFGSIDGVAQAKAEIYEGLASTGTAIINADDDYSELWRGITRLNRQITFGMTAVADVTAKNMNMDVNEGQTHFSLEFNEREIDVSLNLPGEHNVFNALAASACCLALEIPLPRIKAGLEKMQAVKGRMQLKQGIKDSRIFDDTYNANPFSLAAALKVLRELPGSSWLVLGDMGELGKAETDFHRQAGERARAFGIERLYGLGKLSSQSVEEFGAGARHFSHMDELIETLRGDVGPGVNLLVKGSRAMGMERIVNAIARDV